MKKFFKAFFKGVVYALLFLGLQLTVSVWVSVAIMVRELLAGGLDPFAVAERLMAELLTITLISGVLTVALYFVMFRKKGIARVFAFNRPPRLSVPIALVTGVLLNIVVSWVLDRIPIPESLLNEYVDTASLLSNENALVSFVSLVLVPPVVEEMTFRALVLPEFKKGMPAWLAVALSGLVFGAMHGQSLWIAYAALLGILLGALRLKTNSIFPCVALHLGFNAGNYPLELILRGGDTIYLIAFILSAVGALTGLIYLFVQRASRQKRVALILLAAGNSTRFNGEKLTYVFEGARLIDRALAAASSASFSRRVCVAADGEVADAARRAGFDVVVNKHPERGISSSIRLGIGRANADAYMFMVADQPRLTSDTVAALADFWRAEPARIAALGFDGNRGNPCVFPEKYVDELWRLAGDEGGNRVIAHHIDELRIMEVRDSVELFDVDTRLDALEVENA